jgi:hypothetical protein
VGVLTAPQVACAGTVESIEEESATFSNTENSLFHFDLGDGYSTTAATDARAKEDTTPLFFWPTSKTFDMCYIYAEGWKSSLYRWVDYTVGGFGAIRSAGDDSWYSLKSNVYEYGCRLARITAWQCSQAGNIKGYWSPDSQKTYTICNNGY